MRKIIIFTVFFIGLIFVLGEPARAALYGTIRVNYTTSPVNVKANETFTLIVDGFTYSPKVVKKVGFARGGNWYYKDCVSSSPTCSMVWDISESASGTYQYTGVVYDSGGGVQTTNNATVIVTVSSGQTNQPVQGTQNNQGEGSNAVCPVGAVCLQNPLGVSTFDALLNKIIDFIFWVGMAIAPVIFIIAGFLFVISAGDTKKLETAKHMMLYAVIGLVVLLLARGLVAVLKSVIGVQ